LFRNSQKIGESGENWDAGTWCCWSGYL